jgi:N-formylglutamate amidohydrolase
MIPIVLHIPHASRRIPARERAALLLDGTELARELTAMTDAWTDRLVEGWSSFDNVRRVIAPVSRLVCDVERFRDDAAEPMAARGMGAVYTRTSDGRPLRTVTPEERERILRTYYDPHHAALTQAVDDALAKAGACLIIDVHSFPSKPLPYEPDQSSYRPRICIGFDDFHGAFLGDGSWKKAYRRAKFLDYEVKVNEPFSGSIVPLKHFKRDRNVFSVMVEVRRDLYMNEATGRKHGHRRFQSFRQRLHQVLDGLAECAWRMTLPYRERVRLIWPQPDDGTYRGIVRALEPAELRDLRAKAKRMAREAMAGQGSYADPVRRPKTEEERDHLARLIEQELLLDAAWPFIQDKGEVIDEYVWDGAGFDTSPGSSFWACVRHWNGLYCGFSDVDAAGPFLTEAEAVAWMEEHVGLSEEEKLLDEGPGWTRKRKRRRMGR